MLAQQRHAQVVDGHLVGELERAVDDVLGIDRTAFAPLAFVGGCLSCHGLPPSCQAVTDGMTDYRNTYSKLFWGARRAAALGAPPARRAGGRPGDRNRGCRRRRRVV